MGNIVVDPLGYIRGGGRDLENQHRHGREIGAWNIWEHMLRYGYIQKAKTGRFKFKKVLDKDWRWYAARFSGQGGAEIGAYRFEQDAIPRLGKGWFTKAKLSDMIDRVCAGPTGDAFTTMALLKDKRAELPYDNQDGIYQARKKRGDFEARKGG